MFIELWNELFTEKLRLWGNQKQKYRGRIGKERCNGKGVIILGKKGLVLKATMYP